MKAVYQPPWDEISKGLAGRPLASFVRRAIALGIDFLVAGGLFLLVVIGTLVILARTGALSAESDIMLEFTFFKNWYSIMWLVLYFTLSVYFFDGLTIGKRVCGIRIVSLVHHKMTLWHSLERALGYGASMLEAGFGFVQYFIRPDRRTVHDRIAETIVVEDTNKAVKTGRNSTK